MTITTASIREPRPEGALRGALQPDGSVLWYVPGDTLPPEPEPDPAAIAAERAHAIRAERERRILAGVKLGSDWFYSGTQEQIQYMGMLMMGANLPVGTPLKSMAGVNVGATPQRVGALFQAIATQQATLHAIGDAAIAAGTDPAAVQWPPTYGEPGA
jgi:hypothetical protein